MYQTILFDLDGTLTEPALGITNSIMYALKKWDIEVEDRSTLYNFIGPPLVDSFAKYYGFSPEDCELALKYYREYFSVKGMYENEIYPGIRELLATLKNAGKTVVLATSKPEEFAVGILKYFEIDGYFDFVAGASMDGVRSKKSDVIDFAIAGAGITDLSATVMIGDREYDILGAKHAGIDSIGVLYGYGNYEELNNAGATHIAGMVEDILSLL
ncbi:MAG: HAD family hydrolase [Lachnospiraceae bacterium]|nr:HAD family hydrolase [Lachnospiraceae bacterium]